MRSYGWLKDLEKQIKGSPEDDIARIELDITEKILEVMDAKNISRAELAEKMGVSKSSISQFFNNGSNITVGRLIRIVHALNCEVEINLVGKKVVFEDEFEETYNIKLEDYQGVTMTYDDPDRLAA
jgi:transcriptional regulator with XRE-family HTH domain